MTPETSTAVNDVHLVGRLGQQRGSRELPSGDEITTFTLVVPRSDRTREQGPTIDSLACQATRPAIRAKVDRWAPGTWVEVRGSLRRRFWNSGHGLASATEVEVRSMTLVRESSGVIRGEPERGSRR